MNRKERFIPSDIPIIIATILIIIFTLYPVIYVVSMSFSEPSHVLARDVYLLPKGFSLKAYRMILDNATVLRSFANTIWYTVVGGGCQRDTDSNNSLCSVQKTFLPAQTAVSADDADDVYQRRSGASVYPGAENASV